MKEIYVEIRPNLYAEIEEDSHEVHLRKLEVEKDHRRKGKGTAYIKELIGYAKRNNKMLTLIPGSPESKNQLRLERFYSRLGFKDFKDFKWTYYDKICT